MKKRFLLLLTLVATMAALPAEAKKDKTTPEQKGLLAINRPTAEAHVGFLASDALKGRESGTEHGHIAGEYLIAVLKRMNATPLFGDSFAQPFDAYSYERRNAGFTVNPESVEKLNGLLHEHGEYIIGRMGIPYRKRNINIISIALDAPQDTIAALAGKIGNLKGISVKTAYSGIIAKN